MLELERPLAIIDADSTGLDPQSARIVRLSVMKVMPDGREELSSRLINPDVPIPPGATAVHGITDDDVAEAPPFRALARGLIAHLEGCDLAGYGIERFDLPLLEAEFRRAGIDVSFSDRAVVDAMVIFHRLAPRDLRAAYGRYVGGAMPATDGEATVRAAWQVLQGEVSTHSELPRDPAALARWTRPDPAAVIDPDGRFVWSPDGEALLNFGRHRGQRLANVIMEAPAYVDWVARKPDFSPDVRRIAADALSGVLPQRPPEDGELEEPD